MPNIGRNESGATAIEYGLIAALIAVVIISALSTVGVDGISAKPKGERIAEPAQAGESGQLTFKTFATYTEALIDSNCVTDPDGERVIFTGADGRFACEVKAGKAQ